VIFAALVSGCAATHQDRAQRYLAQGRLDEAGYEIDRALERDPNNLAIEHTAAEIFTRQGIAEYQRGHLIAAERDFHRAIGYYPTFAAAYDYLGMTAFAMHNWREAIRYGEQGAGYSGQPAPAYVAQARENLRKLRSGMAPAARKRHRDEIRMGLPATSGGF
jgi:tetratricopeptide (TPR) repeat protein